MGRSLHRHHHTESIKQISTFEGKSVYFLPHFSVLDWQGRPPRSVWLWSWCEPATQAYIAVRLRLSCLPDARQAKVVLYIMR